MTEGQIYECMNRDCGCEIQVTKGSAGVDANPRCCCGAEMKKPYHKPIVRKVSVDSEILARLKVGRDQIWSFRGRPGIDCEILARCPEGARGLCLREDVRNCARFRCGRRGG
jgi:hypothetical protein